MSFAKTPYGESEFLKSLREEAAKEESYAPIVAPDTAQLLVTMIEAQKPRRILEIGTAIGYSAILMASHAPCAKIITIERYQKAADRAIDNIFAVNMAERISVVAGEAAEVLMWLDGTFDFVFLDAAKGQYIEFLPRITQLLRPGGMLFSDNVLFRGMTEDDSLVVRRKITIVERLRSYIEKITACEEYTTCLVPVGDGAAISVRR
ncbi:MAG: O-methyltransferase [Clostridia bacterium]|nr:O-methyltransferase [Clostridia bacterium]